MKWKSFFQGMYRKPHFVRRFVICLVAVILLGFCISWLNFIDMGVDPCSFMNFSISARTGLSFGNCQVILNVLLFMIVICKDRRQIGFGTVLNMFLVGYACDFMTWLRELLFPELHRPEAWLKWLVMLILLAIFVLSAAVYMTMDLGTSPYDAVPMIVADRLQNVPFRTVRILWDIAFATVGILVGGKIGIVTILMAFAIGPTVELVGRKLKWLVE